MDKVIKEIDNILDRVAGRSTCFTRIHYDCSKKSVLGRYAYSIWGGGGFACTAFCLAAMEIASACLAIHSYK